MIKITGLCKKFQDHVILDNIDLEIETGSVIAIIGPSGMGKSTFLRCIDLLEEPEKGIIEIEDFKFNIQNKTKKDVVNLRQRAAMVFQSFNLFSQKTALANVMEGLLTVKKMSKSEAEKKAMEELTNVGLRNWADYYPKQLSGGQQQRVAIARALAMKPQLLLLDEPTSALDPELVGEVLDTIKEVAQEGNTMILVSHEMNFVRKVATRVLFLDSGHIVEDGPPSQVFEHPKSARTKEFLARFYLQEEPEYMI